MPEALIAGSNRLVRAFRRRRRLRTGIVQSAYVAAGFLLAIGLSGIPFGPTLPGGRFGPVLVAIAGGLLSFTAVVFSLLFLVVQYGNTALSPRLTLFRDSPLIWHAFGIFVGVFVFCATAAIVLGGRASVTLLVPVVTVTLVVVCLAIMRRLQLNAFRSLQLGGALDDISTCGRRIIVALYQESDGMTVPTRRAVEAFPAVATTVVWPGSAAVLRQIDVPLIMRAATADDVIVEVVVKVGDPLVGRRAVLVVHGRLPLTDTRRYLRHLEAGIDRTFDQDPLLAFRLLSDIALRALSAAVNDPATAVQVLDHTESLLAELVDADLDARPILGPDGRPRVLLRLPTWEEYLEDAVDQVAVAARGVPSVERRLTTLLEHLRELAPQVRRGALDARLAGRRDAPPIGSSST